MLLPGLIQCGGLALFWIWILFLGLPPEGLGRVQRTYIFLLLLTWLYVDITVSLAFIERHEVLLNFSFTLGPSDTPSLAGITLDSSLEQTLA